MNRKIKFRAWSKERNMFMFKNVDFSVLVSFGTLGKTIKGLQWQQYTGLKAKGVEIYEGDIVENEDYVGSVVWNNQEAKFILQSFSDGSDAMIAGVKIYSPIEGEIIGNIYQNKELLK